MMNSRFTHRSNERCKFSRSTIVILLVLALCSSTCTGDSLERDAKLIVAGIALTGAAVATGIFVAVHRSHTSLTGCVVDSADTPHVTTSSGKTYELVNVPAQLKHDERLSFRGHRVKTTAGSPAFWVEHISGDHGPCKTR